MAPSPNPSKLQAERSVKVSVSTLALDLPAPPPPPAASRPRAASQPRAHAHSPARPGYTCAHADCQTDTSLLEPLEAPEADAAAQTATLLMPPSLPAPPPPRAATDASTQVAEDELFDFERNAAPAVHSMVAATLQRAVVEAEGEARLEALRRRRLELEEAAEREQQEVQMLEEAARRRAAERERLQRGAEHLAAAAAVPAARLGDGTGMESTAPQPAAPVLLDATTEPATAAGCVGEAPEASVGAQGQGPADGGTAAGEQPAAVPGSKNVDEATAEPAVVGVDSSTCPSGGGEAATDGSTTASPASPAQEPPTDAPAEDNSGQEGEVHALASAPVLPREASGAAEASASQAGMATAPA